MARTDNLTDYLTDVADAIREKSGREGLIPAYNFDTEILNIYIPEIQDSKTVNPSFNAQIIKPDENYGGLAQVIVNAVTADVDPNIQPNNILEGVSILRS